MKLEASEVLLINVNVVQASKHNKVLLSVLAMSCPIT